MKSRKKDSFSMFFDSSDADIIFWSKQITWKAACILIISFNHAWLFNTRKLVRFFLCTLLYFYNVRQFFGRIRVNESSLGIFLAWLEWSKLITTRSSTSRTLSGCVRQISLPQANHLSLGSLSYDNINPINSWRTEQQQPTNVTAIISRRSI